jgi:hypothetical protein
MKMPNTTWIKVEVLGIDVFADFVTAINEIAGTTNDPNTAANLRAALDKLYGADND